jgi:hypothetical protein
LRPHRHLTGLTRFGLGPLLAAKPAPDGLAALLAAKPAPDGLAALLAAKPAPDGLLDPKAAPIGLGSLAALAGCSRSINFPVIAIACGGIAIPVAWKNLGKEGNSNQAERKTMLEKLLKIIPANRILALTAARVARQVPSYEQEDREFIGCDWFKALFEQEVNPVIRLKLDTMIQHRRIKAPADAWFSQLKAGEILELTKARVMGVRVFVLATLTPEREFLILTTRKRPSRALVSCAQRWEIETLFAAFKIQEFNLEDTHVTNLEPSERLFALLVIALAWVVLVGEFVSSLKRLKLKYHGSSERSVFRVGLDCLRQILLSGRSGKLVLDDLIPLLSSS